MNITRHPIGRRDIAGRLASSQKKTRPKAGAIRPASLLHFSTAVAQRDVLSYERTL
jgi:hypothetical protein